MKNEDIKLMEEKIKFINNQIDLFQERLNRVPDKIETEFTGVIHELKNKRSNIEDKFENFKESTGGAYQDLQTGLEMAWEDISIAFDSAKDRFESAKNTFEQRAS